MTARDVRFTWRHRCWLWRHRKLIRNRRELGGLLVMGVALACALLGHKSQ